MIQQTLSSLTPREQVDREIKNNLEKPSVDFDGDPLKWWLNHGHHTYIYMVGGQDNLNA